ncbi:MAG: cytochrome C peroxidase [Gammaproteobacteria bacterium]|nr:cytochrome C peroxidase [Gammaproteobacteria bacterium]MDH5799791.1 cytochrome C peroxidase [Gammaproteobacteria bacterium]
MKILKKGGVTLATAVTMIMANANVFAIDTPAEARAFGLDSLATVAVPEPTNLGDFVVDKNAAIALGKALFWDMQVGSDGQACASCHFHAGADRRAKNQVNPGLTRVVDPTRAPNPDFAFEVKGPNGTLTPADFPTHRLENPLDRNSAILFTTNDTVSSQGTFAGQFGEVLTGRRDSPSDVCGPADATLFHSGGIATRKVEPRNTPTTINAVFNHRNFWDGRANNIFNGLNPLGLRGNLPSLADPNPGVLVTNADGTVSTVAVEIDNASLASQAVGPPLSDFEMSCAGRLFADLGKKMVNRTPLRFQRVHRRDSVLGGLRARRGPGLRVSYSGLIRQAFQPQYWRSYRSGLMFTADGEPVTSATPAGTPTYNQMEVNFSLFWGLAIQMYEATLVSDRSPFDVWMEANATTFVPVPGFGEQERAGLDVFVGPGLCINCHIGPEFTAATLRAEVVPGVPPAPAGIAIERMAMRDILNAVDPANPTAAELAAAAAVYDIGFYNIGVTPTLNDLGIGADLAGFPISFSRQVVTGNQIDVINFDPALFEVPGPIVPGERVDVDGAFKVPTIRNAELTGPYFHNGGYADLASLVEFYNRGGNARDLPCTGVGNINGVGDTSGFDDVCTNLPPDINPLGLSPQQQADLVAFIKATTDPRVRVDAAPFDHPELVVPNGHPGDEFNTTDDGTGKAVDDVIVIPAVGSQGGADIGTFLGQ